MKIHFIWSAALNTKRLTKIMNESSESSNLLYYWQREDHNKIDNHTLDNSIPIRVKGLYGKGIFGIISRFKYGVKLRKKVKSNLVKGDTIFVTDFDSAIFLFDLKNKYKLKFIFDIADFIETFDSNWPKLLRTIIRKLYLLIYDISDFIVLPDKNRIFNIPQKFHGKIRLINNAPVLKNFKNIQYKEVNKSKINIIYYGGLSEDRGLHLLNKLSNNFKNIQIHVAGWGQLESNFKSNSNIIFYGMLDEDNVLSLLSQMDYSYIVYDPKHEHNQIASPNKFFEAIQYEIPMIVSKGTSIDEKILELEIGEIIEYNYLSLCDLIMKLDKIKPKYNFTKEMKNNYSWNTSINTINEILK
jgi:glycosyltransferase involved in cell wall biosynthesis